MPKTPKKRKRVYDWSYEILSAVQMAVHGKSIQDWRDKYGDKNLSQVTESIVKRIIREAKRNRP